MLQAMPAIFTRLGAAEQPRRSAGGGGGRRREEGGRLVFTLVTMSTASHKSLLINTESTWCEYGRELSSALTCTCT